MKVWSVTLNFILLYYQNEKSSRELELEKQLAFSPFYGSLIICFYVSQSPNMWNLTNSIYMCVNQCTVQHVEKLTNRSLSCKWGRLSLECQSREGASPIYTTNTKVGRSWIAAVKWWADVGSRTMGRFPYSSLDACYSSVVPGHYLEMSRNTYLHTWKVEKHCSWQTKIPCAMDIEVKM